MNQVESSETTEERIHATVCELDRRLADEVAHAPARSFNLNQLLGDAACRQLGIYEFPEDFVLSVVIPVYNEEKTLRDLVLRRTVPSSPHTWMTRSLAPNSRSFWRQPPQGVTRASP